MEKGAVALIDALGWKGIWKRYDPGIVLDTVNGVEKALQTIAMAFNEELATIAHHIQARPSGVLKVRFLSDMIVIAISSPPEYDAIEKASGIHAKYVGRMVAKTQQFFWGSKTPLNFRGAVTSGKFLIRDNLIIGEAIDRAATLMDLADGAFVLRDWQDEGLAVQVAEPSWNPWMPYRVPLSDGKILDGVVVNPFHLATNAAEISRYQASALSAFGKRELLAVELKFQHTNEFLEQAAKRQNELVSSS